MTEPGPEVRLALTREEALVLFERLSREERSEALTFAHPAEERALWTVEAQLEKALHEHIYPGSRGNSEAIQMAGARSQKPPC